MKPFIFEEIVKIIFHNNPSEQERILLEYSSSNDLNKANMMQIISDEFISLTDDLAILKYDQFMNEVSAGTRQISGDMMQQAYRAVHEELAQILTGKHQDNQEIKALQQKLQSLAG